MFSCEHDNTITDKNNDKNKQHTYKIDFNNIVYGMSNWYLEAGLPSNESEYYKVFFKPESIFNNTSYFKCYFFNIKSTNRIDKYIGLIRNSENKILFIPKDSINEKLLYNDDWEIGDTISDLEINFGDIKSGTIIQVDTVVLANKIKRKQYQVKINNGTDNGYETFTQGIGNSNWGLIPYSYYFEKIGDEIGLSMYCEDDTLLIDPHYSIFDCGK
jgi:hypothetical protein